MSEVGRSIRWADVRALLRLLPATSHFKRQLHPEQARFAEWSTPEVQLLAGLWDQRMHLEFARMGKQPPPGSVLDSVLQQPAAQPTPTARSRKPLSAAAVRARIHALEVSSGP